MDDGTELGEGLDPLGGRVIATGVMSSVVLKGQASQVVAEGSTSNPQTQTAYVATGSYGLAIVDASRFQKPIVLSQLDLPGDATDVAVDSGLRIVAVASGAGGLHFVNVADQTAPQLLRTINVNASQVEIVEGIAYAAVGTSILAYDLLTGEQRDSVALGGASIIALAREGAMLYSLDSNHRLRAIDISGFQMIARGSLVLPSGGGKLFVGNSVAYVGVPAGGFVTANVANPDNLTLLSGIDAANLMGNAIVANGSGLGIAVGNVLGPVGQQFTALDVINVADPTDTSKFLTRINLPSHPYSVTLAAGIAFVANGTSGLQVVNYLPFDNRGVAPTVTISSTAADLDPNADGVQVLEGTSIPIAANISDDVQVRNVQLLVDGQVARNDVSFPYDLSAIAVAAERSTRRVTVQVRATDTGGNSVLSNELVLNLVPDTFGPTITGTNVRESETVLRTFRSIDVYFNEPIAASTVTASNFFLRNAAGNLILPQTLQSRRDDRHVQLLFATLEPGQYQLVVKSALTDRAGNAMDATNFVRNFTVSQATVRWVNSGSGFWDVADNWSTGAVPTATDVVLIDVPGSATITYSSGNSTILGLESSESIVIAGGRLRTGAEISVAMIGGI